MDIVMTAKVATMLLKAKDLTQEPLIHEALVLLADTDRSAAALAWSDAQKSSDPLRHYDVVATLLISSYAKYAARSQNKTRSLKDRIRSKLHAPQALDASVEAMIMALCMAYVNAIKADYRVTADWAQRARLIFEQVRPRFEPYWYTPTPIAHTPRNGMYHEFGPLWRVPKRWPLIEEIGSEIEDLLARSASVNNPETQPHAEADRGDSECTTPRSTCATSRTTEHSHSAH
ncbi:hypothetical protein ACQPZJ_22195 [Actinoplanes sp. CA-054009]